MTKLTGWSGKGRNNRKEEPESKRADLLRLSKVSGRPQAHCRTLWPLDRCIFSNIWDDEQKVDISLVQKNLKKCQHSLSEVESISLV